MPILSSLDFLIGEALSSIGRNRLMSLAAVLTATVSLAVSAGLGLTALSTHRAAKRLPQEFRMAVFLDLHVPASRVQEIAAELAKHPNISKVTYVSKEKGWEDFRKSLGARIGTSDVLYNPVPDSFQLAIRKPELSSQTQAEIAKWKDVDEVLAREQEIRLFTGLSRVVTVAGLVATLVMFLGSVFIIGNTIRLGIYARREEVAIMRLVGAKPSFIKLPFLIEGMILAGAGAVLAALAIRGAGGYLASLTQRLHTITRFLDSGIEFWQLAAVLFATGLALGALSSNISISRYLKEGSTEAKQ